MKKFIFIFSAILATAGMICCDRNDYTFYEKGRDAIYFSLSETDRDSMVLSLARYLEDEVEVKIPLELAGYTSENVRHYKVRVVAENTTAIEGVHYKALDGEYPFRAGECFDSLTLTLYTTDQELLTRSRRLYIELVGTEELANGIRYKQHLDLRFGTGLKRPTDWSPYPEMYQYYLGEYSRIKHAYILSIFSLDEIPDRWDKNSVTYWDYVGMKMNQFFTENTVLDENGMQIQPWR